MLRSAAALVAALALALAAWLGWHHPLSPSAALVAVVLAFAAAAVDPVRWPRWVLPLLPLIGLMPWTGWLIVEELDLLLLAVAAGGYARWAALPPPATEATARPSAQVGWLLPLLLATAVSAALGVADAGGWRWDWWQGYREPLNAVRLLKPALWVMLLVPLMHRAQRLAPEAWCRALQAGFVGLLTTVALGVVWERWAYTGLADFSSDYRATGLFWEMHVGGAALDAALVLSLPFAALALRRANANSMWLLASAALLIGAYAALATFSRIVYLAAPLAVGLTAWLAHRQLGSAGGSLPEAEPRGTGALFGWLAVIALLALWLFPAGGYRSLLALLGAAALQLPLATHTRPLSARQWGVGLAGVVVAAALIMAATMVLPKGAYAAYCAAALSCAGLLVLARSGRQGLGPPLIAAYVGVLAALVAVGVHWGGPKAWAPGVGSALILASIWLGVSGRRQASWPSAWRWQAQAVVLMAVVAPVVGVFLGGDYMTQRFTQSADDRAGRAVHWQRALDWLRGTDWIAGKGLGRYAVHYGLSGSSEDQVGDYRLVAGPPGRGQVLVQTAGMHPEGGSFRVAQRLPVPTRGPLVLTLDVLAQEATEIHVEVCEKHLLYPVGCLDRMQGVPRPGPDWQAMRVELAGATPAGGDVWAPRFVVFSISVVTPTRRIELDNLDLRDGTGRALLANGDFERGMARWFTTSDRHHLPWHAKNMAVHLLFEQGLLGLGAWLLVTGLALWRVTVGAARAHPLAPALAGAIVGVMTVGLVDSLLDMPRIAFLMIGLLAVTLLLPAAPARARA